VWDCVWQSVEKSERLNKNGATGGVGGGRENKMRVEGEIECSRTKVVCVEPDSENLGD